MKTFNFYSIVQIAFASLVAILPPALTGKWWLALVTVPLAVGQLVVGWKVEASRQARREAAELARDLATLAEDCWQLSALAYGASLIAAIRIVLQDPTFANAHGNLARLGWEKYFEERTLLILDKFARLKRDLTDFSQKSARPDDLWHMLSDFGRAYSELYGFVQTFHSFAGQAGPVPPASVSKYQREFCPEYDRVADALKSLRARMPAGLKNSWFGDGVLQHAP